ncbi:MAG: bifunctional nuclease family protein [Chloroflexi bacterium]|nr:MAG: bifunctional nuclease family protein [Chloroflexota bacterium]
MVKVKVESIQISLMSEHRVILLREIESERLLPIFIGPYEAEAIAIRLREIELPRPLTHDLLNNIITEMGGQVSHITVNALRNDTFYAYITVKLGGRELEIDARPSDAIALAVRANVPIFVEDDVMAEGIVPAADISDMEDDDLSIFRDFVDTLDLDDMPLQ